MLPPMGDSRALFKDVTWHLIHDVVAIFAEDLHDVLGTTTIVGMYVLAGTWVSCRSRYLRPSLDVSAVQAGQSDPMSIGPMPGKAGAPRRACLGHRRVRRNLRCRSPLRLRGVHTRGTWGTRRGGYALDLGSQGPTVDHVVLLHVRHEVA